MHDKPHRGPLKYSTLMEAALDSSYHNLEPTRIHGNRNTILRIINYIWGTFDESKLVGPIRFMSAEFIVDPAQPDNVLLFRVVVTQADGQERDYPTLETQLTLEED